MSDRRAARRPGGPQAPGRAVLPADLAAGPCVETWAPGSYETGFRRGCAARRAWAAAVDQWATTTGWATTTRPASLARNLARTRQPWSRTWLLTTTEGRALAAYLDGRRKTRPKHTGHGWPIAW